MKQLSDFFNTDDLPEAVQYFREHRTITAEVAAYDDDKKLQALLILITTPDLATLVGDLIDHYEMLLAEDSPNIVNNSGVVH